MVLKPGELAPDFVLLDAKGHEVRLSEFEGRKVILWFYPKADTQTVAAEGIAFRDRFHEIEEHNAIVLGVSLDPISENAAFSEKHRLPFPLLSDLDRAMSVEYGAVTSEEDAVTKRITYVIDEAGHVARTIVRMKPDGHADEVMRVLADLL
jgi:peroxiredoxin Q/BCP